LAAAAVGLRVGLQWDEILSGLEDKSARVRLLVVPAIRGTTILDDTYNASPDSTRAALNLLSELDGRKVAVLGDMLELGSYEAEGHRLVGRRAAEVLSVLVTVGKLGRLIAEEALAAGMLPSSVHSVRGNREAVEVLDSVLAEGDFVLVKGSRGLAMESIVAELARAD
jgi:UDP-N-acetylmuramoyl-tripeptide--D-alanyl-D-alanine ligase